MACVRESRKGKGRAPRRLLCFGALLIGASNIVGGERECLRDDSSPVCAKLGITSSIVLNNAVGDGKAPGGATTPMALVLVAFKVNLDTSSAENGRSRSGCLGSKRPLHTWKGPFIRGIVDNTSELHRVPSRHTATTCEWAAPGSALCRRLS